MKNQEIHSLAPFWTRNDIVLNDPVVNVRFEELLLMNDSEVDRWVDHMRARILSVWDTCGLPPLVGKTEREMMREFRTLFGTSAKPVVMPSEATLRYRTPAEPARNVLLDNGHIGQAVNQFFPTMLKTKISYSVYDLFAEERFRRVMQDRCRRHFRFDSFYNYSPSVEVNKGLIHAKTGVEWLKRFCLGRVRFQRWGVWISKDDREDPVGSGYTQVDRRKLLRLTKTEVLSLVAEKVLPVNALENVTDDNLLSVYESVKHCRAIDSEGRIAELYGEDLLGGEYNLRLYDRSTRIFPFGFTAFKIGYSQAAVNFPPRIAKYLYEEYTERFKNQPVINIYDPCAGWGGRLAGALTVKDDRRLHYIGTDPNSDNYLPELGMTRYEYLANFINRATRNEFEYANTVEIFRLGSEVIGEDLRFQEYKGKLDLVFSSPPYFAREIYSEEPTQSWARTYLTHPRFSCKIKSWQPNQALLKTQSSTSPMLITASPTWSHADGRMVS